MPNLWMGLPWNCPLAGRNISRWSRPGSLPLLKEPWVPGDEELAIGEPRVRGQGEPERVGRGLPEAQTRARISSPAGQAANAALWSEWTDWFSGTVFSAGAKGWKHALTSFLWPLWEVEWDDSGFSSWLHDFQHPDLRLLT